MAEKVQKGLDISYYQDSVFRSKAAWKILKESEFGDFIILRAGYGVNPTVDDSFLMFYERAREAGFTDISSYWFSYALNPYEAKIEAENYIKLTEQQGVGLNCMILDLEDNPKFQKNGVRMTRSFVNNQIKAFISVLKEAGLNSAVYASQYVFQDLVDWDLIKELGTGVWNAAYSQPDKIRGWMFQYTSKEYIKGIGGPFDANVRYIG